MSRQPLLRRLTALALLLTLCAGNALAEGSFLGSMDAYLQNVLDKSNTGSEEGSPFDTMDSFLQNVLIGTSPRISDVRHFDPYVFDGCQVNFYMQQGNKYVRVVCGDTCHDYVNRTASGDYLGYPDEVLFSTVFYLISSYDEIRAKLPAGWNLEFQMWFSSTDRYVFNADTLDTYYSWMK